MRADACGDLSWAFGVESVVHPLSGTSRGRDRQDLAAGGIEQDHRQDPWVLAVVPVVVEEVEGQDELAFRNDEVHQQVRAALIERMDFAVIVPAGIPPAPPLSLAERKRSGV